MTIKWIDRLIQNLKSTHLSTQYLVFIHSEICPHNDELSGIAELN